MLRELILEAKADIIMIEKMLPQIKDNLCPSSYEIEILNRYHRALKILERIGGAQYGTNI